jgi:hypothetical protein
MAPFYSAVYLNFRDEAIGARMENTFTNVVVQLHIITNLST